MWQAPLRKPTSAVNRGPTKPALRSSSGSVGTNVLSHVGHHCSPAPYAALSPDRQFWQLTPAGSCGPFRPCPATCRHNTDRRDNTTATRYPAPRWKTGLHHMTVVSRLPTDAASLRTPPLARLATRLDDIARGWLGGIARMLLRLGQFLLRRIDLRLHRGYLRREFCTLRTAVLPFVFRHDGG